MHNIQLMTAQKISSKFYS